MLAFPLDDPNPAAARSERFYRSELGNEIRIAYADINRHNGTMASHGLAEQSLRPWLDRMIGDLQRLRIFYVIANARAAAEDHRSALHYYALALTLAAAIRDYGDMPPLFRLSGKSHRALNLVEDAIADFADAHRYFRRCFSRPTPDTAAFGLELLAWRACQLPLLGRYHETQWAINDCRPLASFSLGPRREVAVLNWAQALVYRAKRRFEEAWHYAGLAASTYAETSDFVSAGRVHVLAGDIGFDVASQTEGPLRARWLGLSALQIGRGHNLAFKGGDLNGLLTSELAQVRFERLSGVNSSPSRKHRIERVEREARRLGDKAAIVQSLAALGDEYAASNEHEAALGLYRRALDKLKGSQFPALGYPIQRAIWLASEMRA